MTQLISMWVSERTDWHGSWLAEEWPCCLMSPPKEPESQLTCCLGRSLAEHGLPQPAGGKQAGACCWLFLAAWWVLVLQCKTKQNIEAGCDCVVRKSSDLPSSAQRLAFHQDMSSFVFQGKDSALYRSSAFTLEILCLTCSLCQKGPDHKKC